MVKRDSKGNPLKGRVLKNPKIPKTDIETFIENALKQALQARKSAGVKQGKRVRYDTRQAAAAFLRAFVRELGQNENILLSTERVLKYTALKDLNRLISYFSSPKKGRPGLKDVKKDLARAGVNKDVQIEDIATRVAEDAYIQRKRKNRYNPEFRERSSPRVRKARKELIDAFIAELPADTRKTALALIENSPLWGDANRLNILKRDTITSLWDAAHDPKNIIGTDTVVNFLKGLEIDARQNREIEIVMMNNISRLTKMARSDDMTEEENAARIQQNNLRVAAWFKKIKDSEKE